MTVQSLIDLLLEIKDKSVPVVMDDNTGWADGCGIPIEDVIDYGDTQDYRGTDDYEIPRTVVLR